MAAQLKGNKFYLHSTCCYRTWIGSALKFLPLHLRACALRAPVFACSINKRNRALRAPAPPIAASLVLPAILLTYMYNRENPAKNTVWERIHESSVADPDPGSGAFLTPGSGMGRKSASGSGMNNPDYIFYSLETIFLVFGG